MRERNWDELSKFQGWETETGMSLVNSNGIKKPGWGW